MFVIPPFLIRFAELSPGPMNRKAAGEQTQLFF